MAAKAYEARATSINQDPGPRRAFAKTDASLQEILQYAEHQRRLENHEHISGDEKEADIQIQGLDPKSIERVRGWQTLRQTTALGAFYLLTTDIIGPFNSGYAFRQNGIVSGSLLYVFMGIGALYGGILVWYLFMRLDSARLPIRSYGDIADRLVGRPFRIFVVFLVFIHMLVNVGTTSLSNAQNLYQMSKGKICFVVAIVIWVVVGMAIGQIRSLKRYGFLANAAVWLNVSLVFISMGMIAHSLPNYKAAKAAYGIEAAPVHAQAFATYPLAQRVNGVMNIVYAYGGATVFPQIITEMRHPKRFLKSMCYAQALIFSVYITYGLFVYCLQGQFTLPVAYQGISRYDWQTAANAIGLVSSVIAGGFYANIGLKILYNTVIDDWFNGPPLMSTRGHFYWAILVVLFWAVGFVVAAAIPQVQTLSGMVGAVTNVQFTFSFPSGFFFIFSVREAAAAPDRSPSKQSSKWRRGLFGGSTKAVLFRWFNAMFCLAALSAAGIGIYGSASFGCSAPV